MASSGCVSFRSAYLYPEDVGLLATRAWLNDSVLGLWCEAAEAGAAGGAHVVCMQPAAVRLYLDGSAGKFYRGSALLSK